jgi:alkanesulfonate monooxygenase SsuD/methylene tetrahydromethanopterin reductase-like flavin-dependent oxidoreductase (luciferase family)
MIPDTRDVNRSNIMHVGMAVIFQGQGENRSDHEVYRNELALGDLAEPLGFESLWGVEHHFTEYTMCPDVLQYLSYFAGRTQKLQLGSMVVVLPWHSPIRVAEQLTMLDHFSGGRFIFGIGRGLGKVEFEGFGLNQEDSRQFFTESAQMILNGLEQGYCEFDGKLVKQTKRYLRPAPFKSFRGRTYAAAVSPESSEIMAKLGIGLLIIPQKPWEAVTQELNDYRRIYREVNGADAPPPINAGWVICDRNADRAREMAYKYIGAYWYSVVRHYELKGTHLLNMRGYESYKRMQEIMNSPGGVDAMVEFFLGLQIWGTPEQCYNRIVDVSNRTGAEAFNGVFSYGGMPYEYAEQNLRTFATEVAPELRKRIPLEAQVIARAGIGPAAKEESFRLHA